VIFVAEFVWDDIGGSWLVALNSEHIASAYTDILPLAREHAADTVLIHALPEGGTLKLGFS
jgi:hypothetical protein